VAGAGHDAGKGPLGGDDVGRIPTDRGKPGVKKSLLVDQAGGPLAAVVAGANVHEQRLLAPTLEALVVPRPAPTPAAPQHLCLDKA
jgi:putative transposase